MESSRASIDGWLGLRSDDVEFVVNASIGDIRRGPASRPAHHHSLLSPTRLQGYPDFKGQLVRLAYVGLRHVKPEMPTETQGEVAGCNFIYVVKLQK